MFRSLVLTLGLAHAAWGFSVNQRQSFTSATPLAMSATADEGDSRRGFFSKAATIAAVGLGSPFLPVDMANAVTGVGKVNAKLKG